MYSIGWIGIPSAYDWEWHLIDKLFCTQLDRRRQRRFPGSVHGMRGLALAAADHIIISFDNVRISTPLAQNNDTARCICRFTRRTHARQTIVCVVGVWWWTTWTMDEPVCGLPRCLFYSNIVRRRPSAINYLNAFCAAHSRRIVCLYIDQSAAIWLWDATRSGARIRHCVWYYMV